MTGIKFYRDPNGASKGFNGLAVFVNHPEEGRDHVGKYKHGWLAIIAQCNGAGDGPYVCDRTSENYVNGHCTEIDEATARRDFPRLVKMLEDSADLWRIEKGD